MATLIVRGERVVLPDGIRAASILVSNGRISAIGAHTDRPAGVPEIDAGSSVVLPGLVDTHVHVNDPGRASWEGFEHATRAAAAAGVTTIVDMPLNSIPATTTVFALEAKRRAAAGNCYVDVAFWGGVVPGNTDDLEPLARAGVAGFKCFLAPSGVEEFRHVEESDLRHAFPVLARVELPLLVHAELPERLIDPPASADPRRYATWLESRPSASEHGAIELVARLSREYGVHVHVVHLAASDALSVIRRARDSGAAITVETCPHYITFAAEDIADGATAFKCAPPIRSHAHREGLWQALADGEIDLIATDHSPAPAALKHLDDGDFLRAWGGIASLQLGLAAVWTGAAPRGLSIAWLAQAMAAAPARLAGFGARKGSIAPGRDADLVIWDPEASFTVDPQTLHHRHPITPYAGRQLRGRVVTTLVRGEIVYDAGEFATPRGELLRR
jgi:allantoinase